MSRPNPPRVEIVASEFASVPRPRERVEGVTRDLLYRWAKEGDPLLVRVGRKSLVDLGELRAAIRRRASQAA